jgi:hypothetical protein
MTIFHLTLHSLVELARRLSGNRPIATNDPEIFVFLQRRNNLRPQFAAASGQRKRHGSRRGVHLKRIVTV